MSVVTQVNCFIMVRVIDRTEEERNKMGDRGTWSFEVTCLRSSTCVGYARDRNRESKQIKFLRMIGDVLRNKIFYRMIR